MTESSRFARFTSASRDVTVVEWLDSGSDAEMLRVEGPRRSDGSEQPPFALVVRRDGDARRLDPLPTVTAGRDWWGVAFLLEPQELKLADEIVLQWSNGDELALTGADVAAMRQDGGGQDAVSDRRPAQVIQQEELNKRRAQRAAGVPKSPGEEVLESSAQAEGTDASGEEVVPDASGEEVIPDASSQASSKSAVPGDQAADRGPSAPLAGAEGPDFERESVAADAEAELALLRQRLEGLLQDNDDLQAAHGMTLERFRSTLGERDDLNHALNVQRQRRKDAEKAARKRKGKLVAIKRQLSELMLSAKETEQRHAGELQDVLERLRAALDQLSEEKQARAELEQQLQRARRDLARLSARAATGAFRRDLDDFEADTPLPDRPAAAVLSQPPADPPEQSVMRAADFPRDESQLQLPRPLADSDLLRRISEQASIAARGVQPSRESRIAADIDAAAENLRAAAPEPTAETASQTASEQARTPQERVGFVSRATSVEPPPGVQALSAALLRPLSVGIREVEHKAAEVQAVARSLELVTVPAVARSLPDRRGARNQAGPVRTLGRMRSALVRLAQNDSFAAGRLIAALLPAQAAWVDDSLDYDLTIRELGTFAVVVENGSATVSRLQRPRGRKQAEMHVSAPALALAELLAGRSRRVGRVLSAVRLRGPRQRLEPLLELGRAKPTLIDVARAGAHLDPALVLKALPYAIDPEWIGGRRFSIASEFTSSSSQRWLIRVEGERGLRVVSRSSDGEPDASVRMSHAAFDRLMRAEPQIPGDKPMIRGDYTAVELLRTWCERARLSG